MYTLKSGESVSKSEIEQVIEDLALNVIEVCTPYAWIDRPDPFERKYNGRGRVVKMNKEDILELNGSYDLCCLFRGIYLNDWWPNINFNGGIEYMDQLNEWFGEWKEENFDFCDENGKEINTDLYYEISDIFSEFISNTSPDIYYKKLLEKFNQETVAI